MVNREQSKGGDCQELEQKHPLEGPRVQEEAQEQLEEWQHGVHISEHPSGASHSAGKQYLSLKDNSRKYKFRGD